MINKFISYHRLAFIAEQKKGAQLTKGEKTVIKRHILKMRLVNRYVSEIRVIYKRIVKDYLTFYQDDAFDFESFKKHYRSFFISTLREIFDKTAKVFGTQLRKENIVLKADISANYSQQLTESFAIQSEKQTTFILDTFAKDLKQATNNAYIAYEDELNILNTQTQETQISISQALLVGIAVSALTKKLTNLNKKLDFIKNNKLAYIKDSIKQNMKPKIVSRSNFATTQAVGYAQSESQHIEALSIAKVGTIPYKEWSAILDSRTRIFHAHTDGIRIPINDVFVVGGDKMRYPRDPNASIENTANCRCDLIYNFK